MNDSPQSLKLICYLFVHFFTHFYFHLFLPFLIFNEPFHSSEYSDSCSWHQPGQHHWILSYLAGLWIREKVLHTSSAGNISLRSISFIFKGSPVHVKQFLLWVHSCGNAPWSELVRAKAGEATIPKKPLKESMMLGSGDVVLCEMGSEQARQVLCSSLAVHLYAKMDVRIAKYIITHFCDRGTALLECVVSRIWDRVPWCRTGLLCNKHGSGEWSNSTKVRYQTAP